MGDSSQLSECAAAIDLAAEAIVRIWTGPQSAPGVPVPATQLRVLFVVKQHGSINLSGLAGELGALLSSASRLCDRLEAAGLILRESGQQSRREIAIRLSPDGEALLDRVRQERQEEIMKVLAQMPASARRSLLNGLTEFRNAADGGARTGASGASESFQMPA
ncbi:MarR family transcriptional regulator [Actinomadura sp. DC4]|uniref:MarR family winged helix-turn-helix transcriptional regulator n=1 Tax=Actinomadura sp. DC4 TaxID=3055069 RepID=UPI0025B25015|nr:MarR family transcriptional regulator [Actinomadura sp. DC4]MDN3358255.1 MarR family transcriptional regulator [Actinomadura sp. DC4]